MTIWAKRTHRASGGVYPIYSGRQRGHPWPRWPPTTPCRRAFRILAQKFIVRTLPCLEMVVCGMVWFSSHEDHHLRSTTRRKVASYSSRHDVRGTLLNASTKCWMSKNIEGCCACMMGTMNLVYSMRPGYIRENALGKNNWEKMKHEQEQAFSSSTSTITVTRTHTFRKRCVVWLCLAWALKWLLYLASRY